MGRLVEPKLENINTNLDTVFLNKNIPLSTIEESIFESKIKYQNINIFYHMFCITDAFQRFNRTLTKIVKSGLINVVDKIYVNCVGEESQAFSEKISNLNLNELITISCSNHHASEADTLNLLRNFAITNPNGKSLYLHSKGVWRNHTKRKRHPRGFKRQAVQDWIDAMEYFLIEEYESCIKLLDEYDNCGIRYYAKKGLSMYAGNFWWATNKYLSSLGPCSYRTRHHAESSFLKPKLSKHKELYQFRRMGYAFLHPRSRYTDKPPLV